MNGVIENVKKKGLWPIGRFYLESVSKFDGWMEGMAGARRYSIPKYNDTRVTPAVCYVASRSMEKKREKREIIPVSIVGMVTRCSRRDSMLYSSVFGMRLGNWLNFHGIFTSNLIHRTVKVITRIWARLREYRGLILKSIRNIPEIIAREPSVSD